MAGERVLFAVPRWPPCVVAHVCAVNKRSVIRVAARVAYLFMVARRISNNTRGAQSPSSKLLFRTDLDIPWRI